MSGMPCCGTPTLPATNNNPNGSVIMYDDHLDIVNVAVTAERQRCLEILEKTQGYSVDPDGCLFLDPDGELVSRSLVETAIRLVVVK